MEENPATIDQLLVSPVHIGGVSDDAYDMLEPLRARAHVVGRDSRSSQGLGRIERIRLPPRIDGHVVLQKPVDQIYGTSGRPPLTGDVLHYEVAVVHHEFQVQILDSPAGPAGEIGRAHV